MAVVDQDNISSSSGTGAAISLTASSNTCTANITNNLSNRNLIINGAMQCAQYGSSSTTSGYGSVDRMKIQYSGTDEAPTHEQVDVASGTTPYTLGFRKALKITNGNQTGGLSAADFIRIDTALEAQDLATSGWNYTSASSYITVSYWVKSSVAQEFFGYLYIDDTPYKYGWSLGSLSADTWTKITKTIPGNSNLGINNDNGVGCWLNLLGIWGTDKTASDATPNTWAAWDGAKRSTDQATTWYTTNDATFEITGVQLEVSEYASDYEHLPYGVELDRCQRYFQTWRPQGQTPPVLATLMCYSSSAFIGPLHLRKIMRAAPTLTNNNIIGITSSNGSAGAGDLAIDNATPTSARLVGSNFSGLSAGNCTWIQCSDQDAYLDLSAEL